MEKEYDLSILYAKKLGFVVEELSIEYLDGLKNSIGYYRFVAEQKIRVIVDELNLSEYVDNILLTLLNNFDYSDINSNIISEREVSSVIDVLKEFHVLPVKSAEKVNGYRGEYGSAEERAKEYKEKLRKAISQGYSVSAGAGNVITGVHSKKHGTKAATYRQQTVSNPIQQKLHKQPTGSGTTLTAPKIQR